MKMAWISAKAEMEEKEKHIRKCYKLMREAKGSILYPKEVKK